jgi:uncharacterized protein (TIGR02246 family)
MLSRDQEEIWQAIHDVNAAWTSGHPERVGALFHDDVVMVGPGLSGRVEGREAMIQTFVDYCHQVKTHTFEELDRVVDVFGNSAVATYRFFVRYEIEGAVHEEFGQEIVVFARREGRWGAVWRTQIPAIRADGASPAA